MFSIIFSIIIAIFEFLFSIVMFIIDAIIFIAKIIIDAIIFIAKIIIKFIVKFIPLIFKFLLNMLNDLFNLIKPLFKIVLKLIKALTKWILKVLKGLLKFSIKAIKSIFKWIKSLFSSAKSATTVKVTKGALIAKKATVATTTAASLTLNHGVAPIKTTINVPTKALTSSTKIVAPKINIVKAIPQKRIGAIERNLIKSAKETKFAGKTVYKRDNLFNIKQVDAKNRTNLQRMKEGLAPLDKNKKPIELHHIKQENSKIIELKSSEHKGNYKVLHRYKTKSVIDRKEFNNWKKQYWKERAKDFE